MDYGMGLRSLGLGHALESRDNYGEHKADAKSTDKKREVVNHLNPFG